MQNKLILLSYRSNQTNVIPENVKKKKDNLNYKDKSAVALLVSENTLIVQA